MTNKLRERQVRFASILTVHAPDANSMLDMMRYDRCYPLGEANVEKIIRLTRPRKGDRIQASDHIVQLMRTSANNDEPSERWRSFCCSVLDERAPDAPQLSEADLGELAASSRKTQPAARRRRRQPILASLMSVSATSAESIIRVMHLERCCPAQEIDSGKIERLAGGYASAADQLIRLIRFASSNIPPDDSACERIGCDILDERSTLNTGPGEVELAHLATLPRELRGRGVRR